MTFPLPGAPLDQLWSIELLGMKADFFQVALVAGNGDPSSILAWRIPWTEEPGGEFIGSQRVRHD